MLNFWAETLPCGQSRKFEVYVINDRDQPWQGEVRLRIVKAASAVTSTATAASAAAVMLAPAATPGSGPRQISVQLQPCQVPGLGRQIVSLSADVPTEPGDYQLVAEIVDRDGKTIHSLRDFKAVRGK
jgi:hypothetical protein